jgi:hypothetical protein
MEKSAKHNSRTRHRRMSAGDQSAAAYRLCCPRSLKCSAEHSVRGCCFEGIFEYTAVKGSCSVTLEMALASHCKRPCLETWQETPVAFLGQIPVSHSQTHPRPPLLPSIPGTFQLHIVVVLEHPRDSSCWSSLRFDKAQSKSLPELSDFFLLRHR